MLGRLLSLLLIIPFALPAQTDSPTIWKAGTARVKITPDKPLWMSGYSSRTKPAEGTLIDLWAKALVLADPDGQAVVLITLDLVGIPRDLSVAVCADISRKHKLPRQAICLAVSHTHTGPVVGNNLAPCTSSIRSSSGWSMTTPGHCTANSWIWSARPSATWSRSI